mgnify:CR=1 FL=1
MSEQPPTSATLPVFRPALRLLLLLLVLAELAARWLLPAIPTCAETRRNPYRFRGWPEYVGGVEALIPSNRTVVILTNCQGYGAELPGRLGYPAVLERVLEERQLLGSSNWRVVNWALDGATCIEYTLLAAYLDTLQPDVVIASMAFADFRGDNFAQGYSYSRSDASRLATREPVFRKLPRSFLRRHWKVEDALNAWCFDRIALLRLKEYAWSWLEGAFPGSHYTLYAPAMNFRPWRIEGVKARLPDIRPIGVPRDTDLDLAYDERSSAMVDELAAVLAAGHARVALVAQPLRDEHSKARQFAADLSEAARRHGLEFWDLQQVLPRESFLTSNHMNRHGHRLVADELAGRLEAWLGTPPGGGR